MVNRELADASPIKFQLSAADDHCRDTMRVLSRGILQRLNEISYHVSFGGRKAS
jgi:hypothetical protein